MALKKVISAVQVRVDSKDYSIIAGSLSYDDGFAERTVINTEAGEIVYGEDPSTRVGMIKFSVPSTGENLDSIRKFQRGLVTVKFYDDDDFTRTMGSGVCLNGSEKSTGSDGNFEVSFEGDPLA